MDKKPINLVGYCGLYCGACGIYQGKIKQAVENLRKIIYAYGFDRITSELAEWEPAFQHYAEFEKVLDGLVKLFGNCSGCKAGGGDPNCTIRKCCEEKGFISCAECAELSTCEKLKRYPFQQEEILRIKAIGIDKWIEEMQKKVSKGFCYLDKRQS